MACACFTLERDMPLDGIGRLSVGNRLVSEVSLFEMANKGVFSPLRFPLSGY